MLHFGDARANPFNMAAVFSRVSRVLQASVGCCGDDCRSADADADVDADSDADTDADGADTIGSVLVRSRVGWLVDGCAIVKTAT